VELDPKIGGRNELLIALEIDEAMGKLAGAVRTAEICNNREVAPDHNVDEAAWKFAEAVRTAGCGMGRRITRDNMSGQSPTRHYSFNKEDIDVPIVFNGIEVLDVRSVLGISHSQHPAPLKIISRPHRMTKHAKTRPHKEIRFRLFTSSSSFFKVALVAKFDCTIQQFFYGRPVDKRRAEEHGDFKNWLVDRVFRPGHRLKSFPCCQDI
jgi:hypothetical protein